MYWGKKKFTDYYGHECEKTFGRPLVLHRAKLVPGMLKTGLFPVFCHPVSYCEVLPARFVTLACFSPRYQTYRKIHSVHGLSLFYSKHCNISFLFPRCVYRCAWMHSRAVLLSPLQIMIKMNLFFILGRLQGHIGVSCVKYDYVGME